MIYLDNAATTIKKPDAVYDAVLDAMKHCGNSGRGMSDASLDASRKIYEARMCLTEFFGGEDADRLVFTANSTESLNIAIHGLLVPQGELSPCPKSMISLHSRIKISQIREQHRRSHDTGRCNCLYRSALLAC